MPTCDAENYYSGERQLYPRARDDHSVKRQLHFIPTNEVSREYTGKRLFDPLPATRKEENEYSGKRLIHPFPTGETEEEFPVRRLEQPLPSIEVEYDISGIRQLQPLPTSDDDWIYSEKRLNHHPSSHDGEPRMSRPLSAEEDPGDLPGKRQFYPVAMEEQGVDSLGKRLFHPVCDEYGHYYESDSGVSSLYEPLSFPATASNMDSEIDDMESQQGNAYSHF